MQAIHTFSRVLLATMAFSVAFLLTPRAWVEQNQTSTSQQVPVTTLEDGNSCLWCDEPPPGACDDDDDGIWLNPDAPTPEECDDASRDESGPNA